MIQKTIKKKSHIKRQFYNFFQEQLHINNTHSIAHLDLRTPNPAHSRQLVLQQKVVCLIVKAPLADGQVGAIAFDLKLKHIYIFCLVSW